jgi:hypothetical protein
VIGLRYKGKALGIDINDPRFAVYSDRDSVGEWENVILTAHGSGKFDVRFVATNRQFTVTPWAAFESRPAGAIGGWELFYATRQPDGSALLYRFEEGNHLVAALTIEETK